jgi:hypothetical protein
MSARPEDVIANAIWYQDSQEVNAHRATAALRTAGLVIEQGWQPIETAPRDGTPVLIGCGLTQSQRWAVWSGGMWRDGQESAGGRVSGVPSPTHWRPLPTPPEG